MDINTGWGFLQGIRGGKRLLLYPHLSFTSSRDMVFSFAETFFNFLSSVRSSRSSMYSISCSYSAKGIIANSLLLPF